MMIMTFEQLHTVSTPEVEESAITT